MHRTTIKRGATLQFDAAVTNAGVPVDLTGWTISSQVRSQTGALIGAVLVTVLDQAVNTGQYRLHAQTAGWPVGVHIWDIAYSYDDGSGGQTITYTETVRLAVEPAATEVPA